MSNLGQFQLTRYVDMWNVTILVEGIENPLYLSHMDNNSLGWTNNQIDAKRFQYRKDAIKYTLEKTKLRRWREPYEDGYIEVRFDEQTISLNWGGAYCNIPTKLGLAIHNLPIFT